MDWKGIQWLLAGCKAASSLPSSLLCLGLAMCACLGGMLSRLWIPGFPPHPNLAGLCSQVMRNSKSPLKQGRFSSARRLPSQGNVAISQPPKDPYGHVVYLSRLTSSYQSRTWLYCALLLEIPEENRGFWRQLLKREIWKNLCAPLQMILSLTHHMKTQDTIGKNPSFLPCAVCLFVSM